MRIIDVACFFLAGGEYVERVVFLVGVRVVTLLRYDGDNRNVIAYVGNHAKQLPLSKANAWIRARL